MTLNVTATGICTSLDARIDMERPLLLVDLHHADNMEEVEATYVLLHDLSPDVAQRAVNAFHHNAADLVDVDVLMSENGIRDGRQRVTWAKSAGEFLAMSYEHGTLRDLPKGVKLNAEVWEAFITLCRVAGHLKSEDGPPLH